MRIFIMRHGEAQSFASSDEQRPLTGNGECQSSAMARWLADQLPGEKLDTVIVSPYMRAQQTWQACSRYLPAPGSVLTDEGFTPYGNAESVVEYLKALIAVEKQETLLIVSHLPLVGYMTAGLVPGLHPPMFPTSAISCVEYEPETGNSELLWLKKPEQVRDFS